MHSIQRFAFRKASFWHFFTSQSTLTNRRPIPPFNPFLLFEVPDAFQHGPGDQGQRHRRVVEHFRETPALFRRHKLSPRYRFRVRASAQAAPVDRLRANPHAIVVPLQRKLLVPAPSQQFRVHPKPLRPLPPPPPPPPPNPPPPPPP